MKENKKLEAAIKYANSSSSIENMNPTQDELNTIKKMLQEEVHKQKNKTQKRKEKNGKIR